ncbi:MAG TPA: Gfo/Idh/MocA family oxidoreductase [Acidobacteriota bacterium]|nr:Gfo/Idh/MocA family oxidoreductase [Acidobacteriota bacterium]
MARPIRLGIVGCGRVTASRHLPALQRVSAIEVVALADTDLELGKKLSAQYRIPHTFSSVEALLDSAEVDAVAVCVPARFHEEVALPILHARKALFIEKPLALSVDSCFQIIRAAEQNSCIALVGFNLRWHRLVLEARERLSEGVTGAIELISGINSSGSRREDMPDWRFDTQLGGGLLKEQAIHMFDLWRYLLGCEIQEVHAFMRSETAAVIMGKAENGAQITFGFSEHSVQRMELQLLGDLGCLELNCYRMDGLVFQSRPQAPGNFAFRFKSFVYGVAQMMSHPSVILAGGDFVQSYENEWRHFAECIRKNQKTGCGLNEGLRAIEILEAVLQSAQEERPVTVRCHPVSLAI